MASPFGCSEKLLIFLPHVNVLGCWEVNARAKQLQISPLLSLCFGCVSTMSPGCHAKHTFCDSNPCKNGGTCSVGWGTFSCECPVGFGGKDCRHGECVLRRGRLGMYKGSVSLKLFHKESLNILVRRSQRC